MAAGQGKRMHSARPKVLHPLAGRPLVAHVLDAVRELSPRALVLVVGHGGDAVRDALAAPDLAFVTQDPPRGTGDDCYTVKYQVLLAKGSIGWKQFRRKFASVAARC